MNPIRSHWIRQLPVRHGLGLVLVATALSAVPTMAVQAAHAAPGDPSVIQEMKNEAKGAVKVSRTDATDRVGFISASDDLFPSAVGRAARSASGAADKAAAYVARFGKAFGGKGVELTQSAVTQNPAGHTVDFTQTYQGLPVFGSKLRAHIDDQGDLTSVAGFAVPGIDVSTTPRLDRASAIAKAKRMVRAKPAGHRDAAPVSGDLSTPVAELSIYRLGALQGVTGRNLLAWVIEVTDKAQVRETVVLDAITGKPVNRYSMIAHALDRELHEETIDSDPVWSEGDAFPGGLDSDQANEVMGTGEAYWFFKNSFGRDSFDGAGAKMITVNNDPTIDCPNANWNGISTNYCSGVSSDDTVAHEWGHAYTEYTSGLLYQWQSGAMNEAYSDIWGETVDMLNSRENETPDTVRTVGDCSKYSLEGKVAISITAPAEIAGDCVAVKAAGGPDFPDPAAEVTTVVGIDAEDAATGDVATDGCSPFTNAAEIDGNWLYIDENLNTGCDQADLAAYYTHLNDNAVAAGAVGIVVGGDPEYEPWDMPGGIFTVPAAQIDGASGAAIKSVPGPVTLNVGPATSPGGVADSYRWLSGEADAAFGGAIRDMWNPTCYGDPGKVSDEEYYCDTADSGGVHTNSGVVNHTYALLVDGGSYNGVDVPALGLDKAANVFWHAQTNYLTPISGFEELADGLEASCTDLTGLTTLKQLAVGDSPTGGSEQDRGALPAITAEDCAAVADVVSATELRLDPVQCNFQPMFKKGTVGCGEGTSTATVWSETFENGMPEGWTSDFEHAVWPEGSGGTHFAPSVITDLPLVTAGGTEHTGDPGVLYFNDKGDQGSYGSCAFDEDDYSSRVGVTTTELTVPTGALPRLSFDQYSATEVGWDGGNVKVSVNGSDFELVPSNAWLYNGPGALLNTYEEGNTNPMEGQPSFTGTDGGEPTGAWGSSVIDLSSFAEAGDTVQFRFDFGMDGCNGIDGWYLDNVKLSVCEDAFVNTTPPTITGEAKVGAALSATAGEWTPEPTSTAYQWIVGDTPVSGATTSTYTPVAADAGKRVSVQVTVSAPGYADGVQVSAPTAPVAGPPAAPVQANVVPSAKAKKGTIKFRINVPGGIDPTGLVTVKIKKKTYTGTVVNGVMLIKAKKQLKKLWRKGKHKVNAKLSYPGDAAILPFAAKVKVKLKGKQ